MALTPAQQDVVTSILPRIRPILAHYRADEDMVCEAHLAVCEAVARWREGCGRSLARYVFQAVRNRMVDAIRRLLRDRTLFRRLTGDPVDPRSVRADGPDISRLTPLQRRLLEGKFLDSIPLTRLATMEGVTYPFACAELKAALGVLRECGDT